VEVQILSDPGAGLNASNYGYAVSMYHDILAVGAPTHNNGNGKAVIYCDLLSFIVMCCVVICCVVLCFVVLCCAMLCYAMLCYKNYT
jgi:hypothetical protein